MSDATVDRPGRAWTAAVLAAAVGLAAFSTLRAADALPDDLEPVTDPYPEPIEKGDVRIELELIAEGLGSPVFLTHAPGDGDRLFIVDQPGHVLIWRNGSVEGQPYLDVSDRLVDLREGFDERGLLGLAFHPGFADPDSPGHGRLYTYSSEPVDGEADFPAEMGFGLPPDHQSVVAEWRVESPDADRVDPDTRREIMRVDEPQFNHNGGSLKFGPDGLLYISFGDGGGANDIGPGHSDGGNGQDTTNLLGTIIRIDPLGEAGRPGANDQYTIPDDNPFLDEDGYLPEIWAYGLRNVWRMSFDRETGALIAADVGQEQVEEVNIIHGGGNYGWPLLEGEFLFHQEAERGRNITRRPADKAQGIILPHAAYDHDEGISITGGYLYRGQAVDDLRGLYVFGDWNHQEFVEVDGQRRTIEHRGRLFYTDLHDGTIFELVIGADDRDLGKFVIGFGEDAGGELYVTTNDHRGPVGQGGQVWKIIPAE